MVGPFLQQDIVVVVLSMDCYARVVSTQVLPHSGRGSNLAKLSTAILGAISDLSANKK